VDHLILISVGRSYVGSLGSFVDMFIIPSGSRYAFNPQILIGLALLGFCVGQARYGKTLKVILMWLLLVGGACYLKPSSWFSTGPAWRDELRLHQIDPSHVIQSWPAGWTVPLPDSKIL
jgi:hypothetical protein